MRIRIEGTNAELAYAPQQDPHDLPRRLDLADPAGPQPPPHLAGDRRHRPQAHRRKVDQMTRPDQDAQPVDIRPQPWQRLHRGGTGLDSYDETCPHCKGSGFC